MRDPQELSVPSRRGAAPLVIASAAVGAAAAAMVLVGAIAATQPGLPGRSAPPFGTALLHGLAQLVAAVSGVVALGAVAGLLVFTRADGAERAHNDGRRLVRVAARAAQVWAAASVLMSLAVPAFINSLPVGAAFHLGAWADTLSALPNALAWLFSAVAAAAVTLACYLRPTRSLLALVWLAGTASVMFVAVTGNVSVGLDHDWATDAMGLATVATVVLSSAVVGLLLVALGGGPDLSAALVRCLRLALPAALVALAGQALVAWQQLAGASPVDTVAGLPFVVGIACLVGLAVLSLARRRRTVGSRTPWLLALDVVLVVGVLASQCAAAQLVPPRFAVPQSTQVNYLGYEVNQPPTVASILGLARPNLLWAVLVAAALVTYAVALTRLRRAGGPWPWWRLLSWVAGCALTAFLALSGLWEYSTVAYSWHMLVHMTINMMVPVLLVLGRPLALLTAASRQAASGVLPSAAQLIDEVSRSRAARVLLSPPLVWVNYVGSLFVVYFSPLFGWLMRYHWAHQWMLLHFLVAGLAFFSMVLGPQDRTWRLPYLLRFALLVSVMPFHAIFAVGIMSDKVVIGQNFYQSLGVPWMHDLLADQNVAGQITWVTGEVPALIAVIALGIQWFSADSREAAESDERVDLGEGDELSAYNDLLAELAARDADAARSHPGVPR